MRMRYFTVPSASPSSTRDLAVRHPVEVGHLDRDALRVRAARRARRAPIARRLGLCHARGIVWVARWVRARPRRGGDAAIPPTAPARPRGCASSTAGTRASVPRSTSNRSGLLPKPHEHVLHDLLGQRLVRENPQRESVHRGHVLAVRLAKRRFVAGNESRGQLSIVGVAIGHSGELRNRRSPDREVEGGGGRAGTNTRGDLADPSPEGAGCVHRSTRTRGWDGRQCGPRQ